MGNFLDRNPSLRPLVLAVTALAVVAVSGQGSEPRLPAGHGLKDPVLVVQLPVASQPAAPSDSLRLPRSFAAEGSRIALLAPGGSVRVLTRGFHSACEPDLSFNGIRFVFSGKRTAEDAWNVYEMRLDGSQLRQITRDLGDCRQPIYQGSHYQISDSNDVWYQITFVRFEPSVPRHAPVTSLWSCKLDGSLTRQITFSLSRDFDAGVMWDGRLLYASWRSAGSETRVGRTVLLDINTDGTDYAPFVVASGKAFKQMPCTVSRSLAVFVESDEVRWDGAGTLGCVSLLRPLHTYRPLTDEADGLYHSPAPLPDGSLLVARRPADGSGSHAVYRLDLQGKRSELVFDDPQYHDFQAKLAVARLEPDGRSSSVLDSDSAGKLYCLNVYAPDASGRSVLPSGSVKRLRVLEGVVSGAVTGSPAHPALQASPVRRRILGEVPVSSDGSFNLAVPANRPLELQLLDEHGLSLRKSGWVWTRNHFNQGCIGCHEDPELTPENYFVAALSAPSMPLPAKTAERRFRGFSRDVVPVVRAKCLPCHGPEGAPPDLQSAAEAGPRPLHEALCGEVEAKGTWRYVHAGRARTSPLVWHMMGRNTARPWDGEPAEKPFKAIPAEPAIELTGLEQRLLIEWIDAGAPLAEVEGPARPIASGPVSEEEKANSP